MALPLRMEEIPLRSLSAAPHAAGVSLLQFLEGTPDRQAVTLLRYHAGMLC